MSKVFVNLGISRDGYRALDGTTLEHRGAPPYKNCGAKWAAMAGNFGQRYFGEILMKGRSAA